MSGILIPALYFTSGVCVYAALRHGVAVLSLRANRIRLLFAVLSLLITAHILLNAGAYQAATAPDLVALRRWDAAVVCLFFPLFTWFIGEYTGRRGRRLLLGLSVFWALVFVVNLLLPHGVQFVEMPRLTYFNLPWGESVVDLRVRQRGFWHNFAWIGVLVVMAYSIHACTALFRQGQREKARGLAWALGLFFGSILFNFAVNRGLIEFVHLSHFGFIAFLVQMDLEMMLEAGDQNQRMRAVLNQLPVAICLKDEKGRYQLVNSHYEKILPVRGIDTVGKTDAELCPPELAESLCAQDRLVLSIGQEVESEEAFERNGKPQIFLSRKFPLLRPDGSPYAVCGVYIDITESRHKDAELGKLRQQIWHVDRVASTGAITGSLAHELCQPLNAILNNAQAGLRFLARDKADIEEIREILQDIVRDDKRAGSVIHGLRDMLRKQQTPSTDIDLAVCIDEVRQLLRSELRKNDVEFDFISRARPIVRGNRTQIQQVTLNLLNNALEAMTEQTRGERTLRVEITPADGKARVSVSDSGIGIAQEMLDRVFDSFYTTKPQGLGLGLEVCRSIIETHGGNIWAEANPGRGATFSFTLPLSRLADATEATPGH